MKIKWKLVGLRGFVSGFGFRVGPNNDQHHLEVYLRYPGVYLFKEPGTIIWVIMQASTLWASNKKGPTSGASLEVLYYLVIYAEENSQIEFRLGGTSSGSLGIWSSRNTRP